MWFERSLQTQLEVPEFQKAKVPTEEEFPRWSIRKSQCPVCSQKWRDRTSIKNVKYSGKPGMATVTFA